MSYKSSPGFPEPFAGREEDSSRVIPFSTFGRPPSRTGSSYSRTVPTTMHVMLTDLEGNAATTLPLSRLLQGCGCQVQVANSAAQVAEAMAQKAAWHAVVMRVRNHLAWARLVMHRMRGMHGPVRFVVVVKSVDVRRMQVALAGTPAHILGEDDLSVEGVSQVMRSIPPPVDVGRDTLMGLDAREALGQLHRVLAGRPYKEALLKAAARGTDSTNPDCLTAAQLADLQSLAQLLDFL